MNKINDRAWFLVFVIITILSIFLFVLSLNNLVNKYKIEDQETQIENLQAGFLNSCELNKANADVTLLMMDVSINPNYDNIEYYDLKKALYNQVQYNCIEFLDEVQYGK